MCGLKRVSSTDASSSTCIPRLPELSGEIILEVFTHKSLRRPKSTHGADYCDNERLSELGRNALQTAVTNIVFSRMPSLNAREIKSQRDNILSDTNIESWVTGYGLRDKLRCVPDLASLHSAEEARVLFNSYVGGVFVESGIEVVEEWITVLVEPHFSKPEEPPCKKTKSEPIKRESPPIYLPRTPSPPPPAIFHQPLPATDLPFLSLFHEIACQRRVAVEYQAEFSGPPHAGTWTVKCVVSGIEKGIGYGASKQFAKEMAARQAYNSMGWAPYIN